MGLLAGMLSVPWIVLVATLTPSSAWNDTGHQLIALIAWDNLSSASRDSLVALMLEAPPATRLPSLFPGDRRARPVRAREFFRRAAAWADLIRDVPELHRATWHHRNFYWRQERGRAVDLPDLHVHPENLLERLHHFAALLSDRAGSVPERAVGIAWVLHLVGDIHQPLHCSARVTATEAAGDRGGQDFALAPRSPAHSPRERYSLHAYWDDMLDRAVPRRSGERLGAYLERAAAVVVSRHPRASLESELMPGRFDAWGRESVLVAQGAYPASLRRGREPAAEYRAMAVRVALKRLALAGYRLALMLEGVSAGAGR